MDTADERTIDRIAGWLAASRRTLVFTGAGISTESGIPDFRGPNGVWTREDPALWTIERYLADPATRRARWHDRLHSPLGSAEPNAGHRAVAALEREGMVSSVVTQNIDSLHQLAGSAHVIELHGTTREATCLGCGDRMPVGRVLSRVEEGDDDPHCERCGGLLKTATISFGQALVEADVELAMAEARRCEVCLAVGSTLSVWPAAGVPLAAARAGARLCILNEGPTDLDDAAAARLHGRAGSILEALAAGARRRHADLAAGVASD